jgi:hypothetical protein
MMRNRALFDQSKAPQEEPLRSIDFLMGPQIARGLAFSLQIARFLNKRSI